MPKLISAKTGLLAAATALTATLASPAIASADVVDDMLAKMPSGQISCSQAESQYTNASDYNSKKNQALAAANFHPRGGEIREAIGRMDEAIERCNLNGGGTSGNTSGNNNSGNSNSGNTSGNNSGNTNSGNTSGNTNSGNTNNSQQVIPVLVQPGMPTVDVPVANVVTFRIPDALKMATDAIEQGSSNFQGSSV
ncbi:hypothetical protein ACG98H_11205 [Corynebacterium sp. L4756]|uniref:hypothetical protein n=1 Tax=unclassified Corynebacterium TaxID=2624378 RepID=UPI00374DDA9C